jgi:hypothetical protein
MSVEINEEFAKALRGMLVEHVQSDKNRPRLLWWPKSIGIKVAVAGLVICAGGGAAAATGVLSIPGATVTTQLAAAVTVTGSGTETISLGAQPQGANAINLTFSCLTAGTFRFADGSSETCSEADLQHPAQSNGTLPLALGQHTTVIAAAPGERWRATVFYAATVRTAYKTNADGQTYGTDGGAPAGPVDEPDLEAVIATNGEQGYAYASQLNGPTPTSPAQAAAENNQPARTIPVYESDGKTQIGQFKVGN